MSDDIHWLLGQRHSYSIYIYRQIPYTNTGSDPHYVILFFRPSSFVIALYIRSVHCRINVHVRWYNVEWNHCWLKKLLQHFPNEKLVFRVDNNTWTEKKAKERCVKDLYSNFECRRKKMDVFLSSSIRIASNMNEYFIYFVDKSILVSVLGAVMQFVWL